MRRLLWIALVACTACSTASAENDVYLTDAIKNQTYAGALSNLLEASHGLPPWTQQTLKPRLCRRSPNLFHCRFDQL
jgi:hypothetical protein